MLQRIRDRRWIWLGVALCAVVLGACPAPEESEAPQGEPQAARSSSEDRGDTSKALILIDLQNDFLPGGPLAVPQGDEVVPVANLLQSRFDQVIATKDWHPAGHVSFATSHQGKEPGEVVDLGDLEQVLWPEHCVQDSRGADFPPELDTAGIDKVFFKGVDPGVDSYSAFFDNAHLHSTGLGDYLRENGVEEVYIMGVATDYCVKSSALDAVGLGFRTYLIEDGSRGVDLEEGDSARAIEEMNNAGVEVVTSTEVLKALGEPVAAGAGAS